MTVVKNIIFIVAVLFSLIGCQQDDPKELMLFDFESDAEFDHLYWQCHTLFTLSDEHAAHGTKSLKVERYPSEYPGLVSMLPVENWKGYRELCFDVYSASENPVRLGVRIDDRKDYPDYDDRYNEGFVLKKGMNHIAIPLETLVTTDPIRHLDLSQIHRIYIFMRHPKIKTTLYIDAIKLTQ